jgi:hypothetical protein
MANENGAVYVYEFVGGVTVAPRLDGAVYAYENTVPNPNPMTQYHWDGLGWVQDVPWVWDGASWNQVDGKIPTAAHPFLWLGG